jgi:hypothetical protein
MGILLSAEAGGARAGDGWEEVTGELFPFGTVINLEPSLLVYLDVALVVGERGGG